MVREDFPSVSRWLDQPHVRRWWVDADPDPQAVSEKYGPLVDGSEPTEMFVICTGSRPIGLIQRYRVCDYPEWARTLSVITDGDTAAGIDYLIGEPDALNQGFGSEAIRSFVATIYDRWPVSAVLVSVQQANRASWAALERAGFMRIWAGMLDSDDPSDAGPAFVYQQVRPR
jgi:aminoglycoside 6'-N-acetyltransferase